MFHRTARLPIDLVEARLSDPADRLGHYLDNAVEEDEEVFAEVVSERLKTVKQIVEKPKKSRRSTMTPSMVLEHPSSLMLLF